MHFAHFNGCGSSTPNVNTNVIEEIQKDCRLFGLIKMNNNNHTKSGIPISNNESIKARFWHEIHALYAYHTHSRSDTEREREMVSRSFGQVLSAECSQLVKCFEWKRNKEIPIVWTPFYFLWSATRLIMCDVFTWWPMLFHRPVVSYSFPRHTFNTDNCLYIQHYNFERCFQQIKKCLLFFRLFSSPFFSLITCNEFQMVLINDKHHLIVEFNWIIKLDFFDEWNMNCDFLLKAHEDSSLFEFFGLFRWK